MPELQRAEDGCKLPLNTPGTSVSVRQLSIYILVCIYNSRSQWPRGLRRGSVAARLLRLWVRIPPEGMDVCRECCVFSGRGLCNRLISRPEESYRYGASLCVAVEQDQDLTSSILVLLESCLQTCMTYTIAECTVNKLLMMTDRGTVRNTQSFMTK